MCRLLPLILLLLAACTGQHNSTVTGQCTDGVETSRHPCSTSTASPELH